MTPEGCEKRKGDDRISGFSRSKVLEYMSPGKAAAKHQSIIDRRECGGERPSDMITIDKL